MGRTDEIQRQWAFEGATARLQRLRAEIAQILQSFPELRGQKDAPSYRGPRPGSRYKGKRKISATGRKAVSEGMRKYWARRKAQAKAQAKPAAAR